ncbi:MAG: RnfABCDGE type electron transport complex subunit D [Actinomycetota bacterium]
MSTTLPPPTATVPLAEAPRKLPRTVTIRGEQVPVIFPKWGDPRLKLTATIWTITILGLTVLSFKVSIPQIAVTVLLCGLMEMVYLFHKDRVLAWPASALQTGISCAFIFRVSGTQHGDWWSVNGLHYFVFVALISLLPKYLIRHNGRHIFNPSNIGLAWALLLIGPSHVFSEHLWWAPLGAPILVAFGVILTGAFFLLRQVKMIKMAATFMATISVLIALFALFGRSYWATWHDGPVGGSFYWLTVALSPEMLIFAFFMITDPQTAPKVRIARYIYAVLTAVVCAGLILPQTTEFGIKVAILSSLVLTTALTPTIDRFGKRLEAKRSGDADAIAAAAPAAAWPRRLATAARNPVLVLITVIALAAPVNTLLLSRDGNVELIERGLTTRVVQ